MAWIVLNHPLVDVEVISIQVQSSFAGTLQVFICDSSAVGRTTWHVDEGVPFRRVPAGLVIGLFIGSCGRLPASLPNDATSLLRGIVVTSPITQLHQALYRRYT